MNDGSKPEKKPNRLIHEKSPYLLQHAYNPVDWYPWGSEAFDKAQAEDKPIFLSIGYASCHWCHVMEKECFEDAQVAALMNEAFVCVKVDREERPDLDAAYMAVCSAMGKNCGWPLHILMTPAKKPFFAASYIPRSGKYGLVGMVELVPQVLELWKTQRRQMDFLGADVQSRVEAMEKRLPDAELKEDVLEDAYEKLRLEFDQEHGGFSSAPKFPRPHTLLFLLRYWKLKGKKEALEMVKQTLRQMRLGGIFDQVGFGFHRYSTDERWLVPHFEKMLYDQALLALAYLEAFEAVGAGKFKLTAKETLEYVLRDLAAPEGGFYSAEDADSEGEEGKFYVWTAEEVKNAVPPQDKDLAMSLFGIEEKGNYVERGNLNGKNILHFHKPLEDIAEEAGLTVDELIPRLGRIQQALFAARKSRVRPSRDDKILTDWNGLVIAAFAKAYAVLGETRYLEAAEKAAGFFLTRMRGDDGMLFHRYVRGERAVEGFLDDYAFLIFGLLELYEATFQDRYLQAAAELTRMMVERFWDEKNGGFYQTTQNFDKSIPRIKQVYDGAAPSGNSMALHNLLWLSRLANEAGYEEKASQMLKVFSEEVTAAPQAYTFLLATLEFAVGPAYTVVLVGDKKEKDTSALLAALRKRYLPDVVVSLKPPSEAGLGYELIDGKATAYVCRGQTCMPPTNDPAQMLRLLDAEPEKNN